MAMDLRSAPIMTLSLAISKSCWLTILAVAPRRREGRLVDQVGQIGARKAGRATGDGLHVHVGGQGHVAHVHT